MPLEKTGTCNSCGYEKLHCICHNEQPYGTTNRRNTSGETQRYQHFSNYYDNQENDYARTSAIASRGEDRKFMEELLPVNNETLDIFYARSDIASNKLIEHSMHKHIYGGRKPWPSHTSSRYCPICTLCQQVETYRQIIQSLAELQDVSLLKFKVETGVTPLHTTLTLTKS